MKRRTNLRFVISTLTLIASLFFASWVFFDFHNDQWYDLAIGTLGFFIPIVFLFWWWQELGYFIGFLKD